MHLLTLRVRAADTERALDLVLPEFPDGVHLQPVDDQVEIQVYAPEAPTPVNGLEPMLVAEPQVSEVSDDWRVRRRERFRVPVFGGRLAVRPDWADPVPGIDLEVVLGEEGAAFGSGSHPTTRACLELLCQLSVEDSIVDLGCGSGVLALAAAKLGWRRVEALDVDPRSVRAAQANALTNGVEVSVARADLTVDPPPRATLALANVPAFVHQALAGRMDSRTVVATGIEAGSALGVARAYEEHGYQLVTADDLFGWSLLVLDRGRR